MKKLLLLFCALFPAVWCRAMRHPHPVSLTIQEIAHGSVEQAALHLARLPGVNERNVRGCTALHEAASLSNGPVVAFLLEKGAEVDARDRHTRMTPLHKAVFSESVEVAELLVRAGADLNAVDREGETPLYKTVDTESYEVARLLIKEGADVNVVSEEGGRVHIQRGPDVTEVTLQQTLMRFIKERSCKALERVTTRVLCFKRIENEGRLCLPRPIRNICLTYVDDHAWDVLCGIGCVGLQGDESFEAFRNNLLVRTNDLIHSENLVYLLQNYASEELLDHCFRQATLELCEVEPEDAGNQADDVAQLRHAIALSERVPLLLKEWFGKP